MKFTTVMHIPLRHIYRSRKTHNPANLTVTADIPKIFLRDRANKLSLQLCGVAYNAHKPFHESAT